MECHPLVKTGAEQPDNCTAPVVSGTRFRPRRRVRLRHQSGMVTHVAQPVRGHRFRNLEGQDVVMVRRREEFSRAVPNPCKGRGQLSVVPSGPFRMDVDDPAGVREEVGHVRDAALGQQRGVRPVGQHIVGRAHHKRAPQLGDRPRVEDPGRGTGGEYVAGLSVSLFGRGLSWRRPASRLPLPASGRHRRWRPGPRRWQVGGPARLRHDRRPGP